MARRTFDALVSQHEFTPRQRVNGFMFFAGCAAYDYVRNDSVSHQETLAHYSLLYMLVDTAMDVPGSYPPQMLTYAADLLRGVAADPPDASCAAVLEAYRRCAGCEDDFRALYALQVEGTRLRRSGALDKEAAWRIGCNKGGVTLRIIDRLCTDGQHLEEAHRIGAVAQVLDDMLDADDDEEAGVYTTADCAPYWQLLEFCERSVPPRLREGVELMGVVLASRYPERFAGAESGIGARCAKVAELVPPWLGKMDYVPLMFTLIDNQNEIAGAKCHSSSQ